ncbi:MAG: hypothetical protein HY394_04465 [Candidatus Diapherotrites archaeon]|nr:hypothetical protein [Candidatus Diapherotrites archaeon]
MRKIFLAGILLVIALALLAVFFVQNAGSDYNAIKGVWLKYGVDIGKVSPAGPEAAENILPDRFSGLRAELSAASGNSNGFAQFKELNLLLVDYLETKKDARAKAAVLKAFMDSKPEDVSACGRLSDFVELDLAFAVFLDKAETFSEKISEFNKSFPDEAKKTVFGADFVLVENAEDSFIVVHANAADLKELCADENA